MTRELLSAMLSSRNELQGKDGEFNAADDAGLELLLGSQSGGPAAVQKVVGLSLSETFVTVQSSEQTWLLAYEDIMGIRLKPRSSDARTRTGFRS